MERFRNITIIFLLAVVPPASGATAKSASVLLQEGLYAEQMEGDLDAAIKIYRQVIAESKDMQQAAAQATYRIAVCYLKKGDKIQAAQQFKRLIEKFPGPKPLVAKAQQQLAKLGPTTSQVFGPIIEKVINDDGVGEDFMFDLDTGKSFSASDAKEWSETSDAGQGKSLEDFVMKSGVDLFGETSKKSLMGIDMIAIPVHNEQWDMSTGDVIEQVSMGEPGTPIALSADGQLPKTFVFRTGQGGTGILQITEIQAGKAPRHFKIRYKMLLQESAGRAGRIVFLPDADDVIQQGKVAVVLDLTTGKMLPGNKDKQYFNKLNKGDVAYFDDEGKDLLVCFRGAKITRKTANGKYYDTPDQSHTDNTVHIYIIKRTPAEWTITTKEGDVYELIVLSLDNNQAKIEYRKIPAGGEVWTIKPDLSSPKATIKSFVKAVYDGNLEAARACVSKDGADYDEFKEMLAAESNHPFQAMIKAMDVSLPVEITRKDVTDRKCKLSWYLTLGRVYYFGETKMKKGTHQKFDSYLEFVGDKWLIRDI